MSKIVLVSNSTWNVHNFRLPVIRALVGAGHQVTVVAPVDESVSLLSQEPGVRIVPLRHLDRDSTSVVRNLWLMLELWRVYRRLRPDLVIHFTIKPNIFGNLAAAWLGVVSMCVVTGLGYTFLHQGWVQRISVWLYRCSFRFARKVVFENEFDRDLLVSEGIIQPAQAVAFKGCGVDLQHFSPNGAVPKADKVVFTFVGRLLFDKGIREFVEAAQQVRQRFPNAEFWILGGLDDHNPAGVDRRELVAWAESGAVQYKGATADVRPFMGRSNWIVLPSYREGMSRVLLEALSLGKPLITTDTPGCRETVVDGENGFLVPVKDTARLAAAMAHCCQLSPEAAQAMGQKGRLKAEKEFGSDLIGRQYLELITNEL